jgi:hypothetical protein
VWPRLSLLLFLLWPALASAQNPAVFSTVKTTSTSATSACIGCPVATTTAAANSGMKIATITLEQLAAPSVTTNKLYSVAGAVYFNGAPLATGSSISGTTNTIGMFTASTTMGNSLLTQSGSTVTMAGTLAATTLTGAHTGSGAGLTSIPTSAVSSGNFVATVGSGTGITSSVTTGNAAATTISLNNTAVTPGAYPFVTVDQQGRVTTASTAVITGASGTLDAMSFAALQAADTSGHLWRIRGGVAGATERGAFGYTHTGSGAASLWASEPADSLAFYGSSNGVSIGTSSGSTPTIHIPQAATGVALGGTNLTWVLATPSISLSTCGTGSTIAGRASFFTVTMGTGTPTSCTLSFNTDFANVPACVASETNASPVAFRVAATSSGVTILRSPGWTSGDILSVICGGF